MSYGICKYVYRYISFEILKVVIGQPVTLVCCKGRRAEQAMVAAAVVGVVAAAIYLPTLSVTQTIQC
jgi:hypothetical protein